MAKVRRVFISALNDDNSQLETYCELLEEAVNFVKVQIGNSIITFPYSRILKIKEVSNGS